MLNLHVRDLCIRIAGRTMVRQADCAMHSGELVGLIGSKGSGKSTLLEAMCGSLPCMRGSIRIDERDVAQISAADLAKTITYLRGHRELRQPMTVRQAVFHGRFAHAFSAVPAGDADLAAVDYAMQFAEVEKLAERETGSLSEGERARVMLAQALAVQAPILLVDESASNPHHALHFMDLLRELAWQGKLVVVVLQDLSLALRFCDRLYLMQGGILIGGGAPQCVLTPAQLRSAHRIWGAHGKQDAVCDLAPWRPLSAILG